MKKADSIRQAIVAVLPALGRDGDRLKIWIEKGSVRARMTDDFSFEYSYELSIFIADHAEEPSIIMLAILRWMRVNQPDQLAPGQIAIPFEADILDNLTVDLQMTLSLTEAVAVIADPANPGGYIMEHLAEPDPLFADDLAPDEISPIPPLTEIRLTTGEKIIPDEQPLGADWQPDAP